MLCSAISHMPLHFTFRDSGVAQKHGFKLDLDIARVSQGGRPVRSMGDRARRLLERDYEFLSELHHETYIYRGFIDEPYGDGLKQRLSA